VFEGRGGFKLVHPKAGKHVEFDWSRQVLALAQDSRVIATYHASSGKPSTPTVFGAFHFYLKSAGTNAKGMFDSNFFIRGFAIHGYPDVPTYAASHGCLRVPIPNAAGIYAWVREGTPVDVYNEGGGGYLERFAQGLAQTRGLIEVKHQNFISTQRRGDRKKTCISVRCPPPPEPRSRNRKPQTDSLTGGAIWSSCSQVRYLAEASHKLFSQPRLYAAGQRSEVGNPLQFIVGQLDLEVMLKPGQQIQCLQAVNPERLEEIVVGSEFFPRDFELSRGKIENFV